ncbi:17368_t:CDS:1, partial [Racocetra fulgida]
GYEPYLVKALIDTSSVENIIKKSLVDKLEIKYSNPPKYFKKKMKDALSIVESLELSFQFKGKDKLVSGSDEVFNDFVVYKEPKANFVLGMQWLWLHETKIDPYNKKISIYSRVIPFYKNLSDDLESDISSLNISQGNHTSCKTKRKKKILDMKCPASQRGKAPFYF